jgi:hypothetical protein
MGSKEQIETHQRRSEQSYLSSPVLDLQLDFLKIEIETITSAIRQMDEISKSIKQWTIALWTGAVGAALADGDLAPYVGLTAALPLLFWFVDARYRRIQQMFIWRSNRIRDFLNNAHELRRSFDEGQVVGLQVFDPSGQADEKLDAYQQFVHWMRPMRFSSIAVLYIGLFLISVGVAIGWHIVN